MKKKNKKTESMACNIYVYVSKTDFCLYCQFESTNLQLPEKFVSRFPRSLPDIPLIGFDTASANRR
jgi:uncharacterized protein YcgL (UPF0745 family)